MLLVTAMENSWQPGVYQATATNAAYPIPTPEELEKLQGSLQIFTRTISRLPYDPASWLLRAKVLSELRFPELVLGDCYKARLLIEAVRKADAAYAERGPAATDDTLPAAVERLGCTKDSANLSQELDEGLADHVKLYVGMQLWLGQYEKCQTSIENWPMMAWQMRFRQELRRLERVMLMLMNQAFHQVNCLYGSMEVCREGKKKFGTDPQWQMYLDKILPTFLKAKSDLLRAFPNGSAIELEESQTGGFIKMRRYPWIVPDMVKREPELIRSLKDDFITASADKCVLRASNIRDKLTAKNRSTVDSDVFGVFAATDLNVGERILIENTAVAVLDNPANRCNCCCCVLRHGSVCLPCCAVKFCTSKCADRADKTYHRAVCGKDLTILENASRAGVCSPAVAVENLLLLRCFAISLQGPWSHPLRTPVIAQLTASYPHKYELPYSFENRVVRPTKMLQLLGVDVFTNLNYDTWVLSTILMRLNNNQGDGGFGPLDSVNMLTLNRLRSFFNHSCEPNVFAVPDYGNLSSTCTLRANRHIQAGEELCVEYTHQIYQPLKKRREAMEPWLGGDCQCAKCVREERQSSHART